MQNQIDHVSVITLHIFYLNTRIFTLSAHFYQNIIKESQKEKSHIVQYKL